MIAARLYRGLDGAPFNTNNGSLFFCKQSYNKLLTLNCSTCSGTQRRITKKKVISSERKNMDSHKGEGNYSNSQLGNELKKKKKLRALVFAQVLKSKRLQAKPRSHFLRDSPPFCLLGRKLCNEDSQLSRTVIAARKHSPGPSSVNKIRVEVLSCSL